MHPLLLLSMAGVMVLLLMMNVLSCTASVAASDRNVWEIQPPPRSATTTNTSFWKRQRRRFHSKQHQQQEETDSSRSVVADTLSSTTTTTTTVVGLDVSEDQNVDPASNHHQDECPSSQQRSLALEQTTMMGGGGGSSSSSVSSKLANFRQRAVPAIGLLLGLWWIVDQYQEKGLTILLLILTPGLYYEATSVLFVDAKHHHHLRHITSTPSLLSFYGVLVEVLTNRWWWFLAYSFGFTIPIALHVFDQDSYRHRSHLWSYGMVTTGFMAWILRLNTVVVDDNDSSSSTKKHFRSAWTEIAIYQLGAIATLVPVSFWIAVLSEFSQSWALYNAILVILNDTFAYLFGFTMGKSALLPTISPKKTWEGWLGALVSTVLLSHPVWRLFFRGHHPYNRHSLIVALFVCIVAPFGGFLASTLKRAGGKKDFGNFIPGHGGLVDRLDCQLLSAPFLYLYLKAAHVQP